MKDLYIIHVATFTFKIFKSIDTTVLLLKGPSDVSQKHSTEVAKD